MFFQKRFADQLLNGASTLNNEVDITLDNFSFEKPKVVPDRVWDDLDNSSRASDYVRRFARFLRSKAANSIILETDALKLSYPELAPTEREAQIILNLLSYSLLNDRNPSIDLLVQVCIERMRSNQPLQILTSQCISKAEEVRPAKLDFFLKQNRTLKEPATFIKGVEIKGWEILKHLCQSIDYPLEVTIMVGDMDYYTLDAVRSWCRPEALLRLDLELAQCTAELDKKRQCFFGDLDVSIRRWSELYNYCDFRTYYANAICLERWQETRLIEDSKRIYLYNWGYEDLRLRMRLNEAEIDSFIVEDVVRTAAQYRLEADICKGLGCIQAWAETVPTKMWPVRLSNYDGAGFLPSLILV